MRRESNMVVVDAVDILWNLSLKEHYNNNYSIQLKECEEHQEIYRSFPQFNRS
jgi:hypothetical protein